MPHIFLNTSNFNGDNRFYTNSAILHTTHYKPKVLIIGTYNDGNHQNNLADFFYGRNYFWPVMYNLANNLALGNINQLTSSRKRSLIAGAPNPTLNQILELCKQFELAFADLVQDVLVPLGNHADKYVNNAVRNGQAIDNVAPIVEFLNNNPTIEFVYCTTKFSQLHHLEILWNQIIENVNRTNITFGCIRTPSPQGGFPDQNIMGGVINGTAKINAIARYWVWVNHPAIPYGNLPFQNGFTHFNHNWLINAGIDVNLF